MAVTEVTRRAIIDELTLGEHHWSGRLDEPSFLARLYPLTEMPSTDRRFPDAAGDIRQHRVNNEDWDDDWVFYDPRFELLHGGDEPFLRLLAETVHPVVRTDPDEAAHLVRVYNTHLQHDGYELAPVSTMSGRSVYAARSPLAVPTSLRQVERTALIADRDYLSRQITRMEAAIEADPDLAIGTAKELVETCCKTVLAAAGVEPAKNWKMPRLLKETATQLQLTPEGVPDQAPAANTIKGVLGSLGQIVHGLAELRNEYGTGHGRAPGAGGLQARHARLAAGAASTLAMFLFETHEHRSGSG